MENPLRSSTSTDFYTFPLLFPHFPHFPFIFPHSFFSIEFSLPFTVSCTSITSDDNQSMFEENYIQQMLTMISNRIYTCILDGCLSLVSVLANYRHLHTPHRTNEKMRKISG